jgi:precorrin-3B methylase
MRGSTVQVAISHLANALQQALLSCGDPSVFESACSVCPN